MKKNTLYIHPVYLSDVYTVFIYQMYTQCISIWCIHSIYLPDVYTVYIYQMYTQCIFTRCIHSVYLPDVYTGTCMNIYELCVCRYTVDPWCNYTQHCSAYMSMHLSTCALFTYMCLNTMAHYVTPYILTSFWCILAYLCDTRYLFIVQPPLMINSGVGP